MESDESEGVFLLTGIEDSGGEKGFSVDAEGEGVAEECLVSVLDFFVGCALFALGIEDEFEHFFAGGVEFGEFVKGLEGLVKLFDLCGGGAFLNGRGGELVDSGGVGKELMEIEFVAECDVPDLPAEFGVESEDCGDIFGSGLTAAC